MKKDINSFHRISKTEWLEKIRKDLREENVSELHWEIEEGLSLDPFPHADDLPGNTLGYPPGKELEGWEICESFLLDKPESTLNDSILQALEGGAEALEFEQGRRDISPDFAVLLKGVRLDQVRVIFSLAGELPGEVWIKGLKDHIHTQGYIREDLAIDFSIPAANRADKAGLERLRDTFPSGRLMLSFPDRPAEGSVLQQLADDFAEVVLSYGEILDSRHDFASFLAFERKTGSLFFPEIAALKSFRALWHNIQLSFGISSPAPAFIYCKFDRSAYIDEAEGNMIRASSMALSAILGEADILNILPAGFERESMSRRLARNVHHLLRSESGIIEYQFVARGSYYVEMAVRKFTTWCWERLKEKLAGG